MRFRLKTDTKGYEIDRNARSIASLDNENDAFITASSDHTLTNKKLSYDQLTSVPIRAPANWNETDETQISFIQNKPTITADTQADWEEASNASAAYILNKPVIPINSDTQADWDETDASSAAHILNKPTLATNTDTQSNWDETDTNSAAHILNKPTIPTNTDTQADWDETDSTSAAHILNKPAIPINSDTQADWDETNASSTAFIQNKPTLATNADTQSNWNMTNTASAAFIQNKPTTTTSVTDGSTALVSSGAVYTALTSFVTTTALDNALDDYATTSDLPEYDVMGVDGSYDAGLVAAGSVTHNDEFLRKDGTWQTPTDTEYSVFDSSTAGLVPASGGVSTAKFLSQAGTFITVPPPAAPNLSSYVTTTALDAALDDYTTTSDLPTHSAFSSSEAGLVPASGGTSTALFLSQAGTFITVPPPAAPNLSSHVTTTALNSALTDYALESDLPTTTSSVTNGSSALITSGGVHAKLADYLQTIPQADDATLGGVRIDGNNLSINNSTGILSAIVNVSQSVVHVGVFSLQAATNLRTAQETFIRWKPGLSATDSSSQGLVHNATNNIPQGSLFTCNDTRGVYNVNVQIALTDGTNQGRSFHVAELRVYTNATSTTSRGDDVRTYFLGSGYARMLSGTNKCFYGGSIQITMEQNDQFEILSSRKSTSNSNALDLNEGAEATRLIIDRVVIS